jgi:hypothetical protein
MRLCPLSVLKSIIRSPAREGRFIKNWENASALLCIPMRCHFITFGLLLRFGVGSRTSATLMVWGNVAVNRNGVLIYHCVTRTFLRIFHINF